MQELIARAKELLADGTVTRVLGWKARPVSQLEAKIFRKQQKAWTNLFIMVSGDKNLSKMIRSRLQIRGKTFVCLKP